MRTGTLTGTPLASKAGALPRSCYLSSWSWSPASVSGRPPDDSTCNMYWYEKEMTEQVRRCSHERIGSGAPFVLNLETPVRQGAASDPSRHLPCGAHGIAQRHGGRVRQSRPKPWVGTGKVPEPAAAWSWRDCLRRFAWFVPAAAHPPKSRQGRTPQHASSRVTWDKTSTSRSYPRPAKRVLSPSSVSPGRNRTFVACPDSKGSVGPYVWLPGKESNLRRLS
jgi:hypothetical protein